MRETTIVLGGGGVWGAAWMTGLLTGLADLGLNLCEADTFIGTSAGAIVGTQLASGHTLEFLYRRQCSPSMQRGEVAPKSPDLEKVGAILMQRSQDNPQRVTQLGALALRAQTIPFPQLRGTIAEHVGLTTAALWPRARLLVTAVDCHSGALVAFDADSGVGLIDAVAASCAVPGIYPPAPLAGRFFMDGGVWKTAENAHLARGAARVIILAPVGSMFSDASELRADIAELRSKGAIVALITPDAGAVETQHFGMLDPASRKPAAEAGHSQAAATLDWLRSSLR